MGAGWPKGTGSGFGSAYTYVKRTQEVSAQTCEQVVSSGVGQHRPTRRGVNGLIRDHWLLRQEISPL